jgi:hypothetical protein
MKLTRTHGVLLKLCFAMTCAAYSGATRAIQIDANPQLLMGLTRAEQAPTLLQSLFDTPLEVRTSNSPAASVVTLTTCQQLLAAEDRITDTVDATGWMSLQGQSATCHLLAATAQATPALRSAMPTRWIDLRATRLWPHDTWPQFGDAPRGLTRLSRLDKTSRRKAWKIQTLAHDTEPSFTLEGDEATVIVQVIARADFNHDGWQDWLVLWRGHANGGSWSSVRAAILSRKKSNAPLTVEWLPPKPAMSADR